MTGLDAGSVLLKHGMLGHPTVARVMLHPFRAEGKVAAGVGGGETGRMDRQSKQDQTAQPWRPSVPPSPGERKNHRKAFCLSDMVCKFI